MKRLLRFSAALLALLVLVALGARVALSEPLPQATFGPDGDALARRLEAAVNAEAWAGTGAVAWTFAGRNEHLWDRTRGLARVRWGGHEVLVDLGKVQGRAWNDGEELHGKKAEKLVKKAYAAWVNDSFWLNPAVKVFDAGTSRAIVPLDGEDAGRSGLLVQYDAGGLTPGDAYLWVLGPDDLPVAWRMWVSVIPIGGARASWEGWTTLATGAKVATTHEMGPVTLKITALRGASSLNELENPDPFLPLSP